MTIEILLLAGENSSADAIDAVQASPADKAMGVVVRRVVPRAKPTRHNVLATLSQSNQPSPPSPAAEALATPQDSRSDEPPEHSPHTAAAPSPSAIPPPAQSAVVSQIVVTKPPPDKDAYYRLLRAVVEQHRAYPRAARRARLQGTVVVRLNVSRAGQLLGARVARSSGEAMLDEAALSSVRLVGNFPAAPVTLGNEPITLDMPFVFRLQ